MEGYSILDDDLRQGGGGGLMFLKLLDLSTQSIKIQNHPSN
jgi:hypothetical protein